jgi:hypothetical protein
MEGEALAVYKARQRHRTVILIRSGEVRARPAACERCAREPGCDRYRRPLVQMHHPDYERPELVEWLCPPCHSKADHRSPDIRTWDDLIAWEKRQEKLCA